MTETNHPVDNHQLQAYLDGELEPSLVNTIQSHLKTCPNCREELAHLQSLQTHLETLPDISLSRDLSERVISQLKEEHSLSPAITWTILVEAVAAGAVIGALIPVFQAAGWLPSLLETRLELQAGLNVFLAQLASNWLVWWAGLKIQLDQLLTSFQPLEGLSLGGFSPWLIMAVAGGLLFILNALLLGRRPLLDRNHNHFQV